MTSERPCASVGRRYIKVVSVIVMSAGVAQASPEVQLRSLITEKHELRRVFKDAQIFSPSADRAEASAEAEGKRQAIVIFPQRERQAQAGSRYCHAALSRRERFVWTEELAQVADGDVLVADFLGKTHFQSVRLSRVEDWAVEAPSGWSAVICSVPTESIHVQSTSLPGRDEVMNAVYMTGKSLYFAGNHESALERFRRLRTDRQRYPNAVLFVYAILRNGNKEIAEQLRRTVVDIDRAVDIDALRIYAEALSRAGYVSEEVKVRQRCTEIGQQC